MFRLALVAALVAAAGGSAEAACRSGDVVIRNATLQSITSSGGLNDVHVAVTVKNRGSSKQAGNTLQSVAVSQAGTKTGSKGIPPLGPGGTYTFTYTFQRSSESAQGSTRLIFRLVGDNPAGSACVDTKDSVRLSV